MKTKIVCEAIDGLSTGPCLIVLPTHGSPHTAHCGGGEHVARAGAEVLGGKSVRARARWRRRNRSSWRVTSRCGRRRFPLGAAPAAEGAAVVAGRRARAAPPLRS